MLVIGLTGSIGTGKSTTAAMFAAHGIPVSDADQVVHALYAKGGAAVVPVAAAFPGCEADGAIDRAKLAAMLLGNDEAFRRLEAIVHPLVRKAQRDFLKQVIDAHGRAAVLEIPLLFETRGNERCDVIVVTRARADIMRARVLQRDGMSEQKYETILARQMSDEEKRRRAHFIVDTDDGLEPARRQVGDIVKALAPLTGVAPADVLARFEGEHS